MTPDRASVPLYSHITELLRHALRRRSIAPGVVLLEGPIASALQCTRNPVRQALQTLEAEGRVSRFDGRGYLAGAAGVAPLRRALTPDMLGLRGPAEPLRKTPAWTRIYDAVERDLVHLSVFGPHRVNELELARHCGVGRMVARDVLLRLESLGMLEKDSRQRWQLIALDRARITQLFELRWLLEPAALRAAAAAAPAGVVEGMAGSLRQLMRQYASATRTDLDAQEQALHVELLSHSPNRDLLHSLQRTRSVLTLSKHAIGVSAPKPRRDAFMAEHLAVLQALAEGDVMEAEQQLRRHLEGACGKVVQRMEAVRAGYTRPALPYVAEA